MPQQLFHLAYEGCCIATTIIGRRGRNPSRLMAKMEILQRHPGGHNRLGYSDNMPAATGGRGSVGRASWSQSGTPHGQDGNSSTAPGGHNRLGCADNMTAGSVGWGSVGRSQWTFNNFKIVF